MFLKNPRWEGTLPLPIQLWWISSARDQLCQGAAGQRDVLVPRARGCGGAISMAVCFCFACRAFGLGFAAVCLRLRPASQKAIKSALFYNCTVQRRSREQARFDEHSTRPLPPLPMASALLMVNGHTSSRPQGQRSY